MDDYVRIVGMVIRDLAREGEVIVVGRGSQMLLKDHPAALHVQIVAPFRHRVKTVMECEGLERRAAVSRVRTSDRARVDYLRRYHNVNLLDPQLYDLVINIEKITVDDAVDAICNMVKLKPFQTTPDSQKQMDKLALEARKKFDEGQVSSPFFEPIRTSPWRKKK